MPRLCANLLWGSSQIVAPFPDNAAKLEAGRDVHPANIRGPDRKAVNLDRRSAHCHDKDREIQASQRKNLDFISKKITKNVELDYKYGEIYSKSNF